MPLFGVEPLYGTNISVCPITPSRAFGKCFPTTDSFDGRRDIILNGANALAYISSNQEGGAIYVCPIKPNKSLGKCTSSGIQIFNPFWMTFNHEGKLIYIVQYEGSTVSRCTIESDGRFGICLDSGNTGASFWHPRFIALG